MVDDGLIDAGMSEQAIRSKGYRQMPCSSRRSKRIVALTHEFYPDHDGIATYVQEVARATAVIGRQIEV